MIELQISPKKPRINIGIDAKEKEIDINASRLPGIPDYNRLRNKPSINNVELIGNLDFNNLFPDGLIIDGGKAGG